MDTQVYCFGTFQVDFQNRRLSKEGSPIRIGGRALEILQVLILRQGRVVGKAELATEVWGETNVAEGALRVHVNALRKALDDTTLDGYIATIPGRGYCFVAPVTVVAGAPAISHSCTPPRLAAPGSVVSPPFQLFGREGVAQEFGALLKQQRFVSIVGVGGIGKTTLAIAISEHVGEDYSNGTMFADFGSIQDPTFAPNVVASLFGLGVFGHDPLPAIIDHLKGAALLLILDNCEHVVEIVAALAERLLRDIPGLSILATSREPLRAAGEHVRRLPPLETPPEHLGNSSVLLYPSVRLFLARSRLDPKGFRYPQHAQVLGRICRRLDGNPLAIELTAARSKELGLETVLDYVETSLALPDGDGPSGSFRHESMTATLEWSYRLLSLDEQKALQRLSVFTGAFSQAAAFAVAGTGFSQDAFFDILANLVSKSLVSVNVGEERSYRLLQLTRQFASRILSQDAKTLTLVRHALISYCDRRLLEAAATWDETPRDRWLREHGDLIPEIRASLAWALRTKDGYAPGVGLLANSSPIWLEMGLLDEFSSHLKRSFEIAEEVELDTDVEMRLSSSYGMISHHTQGSVERTRWALRRTLELADRINDTAHQQRALTGLGSERLTAGDYEGGLAWAREFERRFAETAPGLTSRIVGHSLQHMGEFASSNEYVIPAYRKSLPGVRKIRNSGVQYDERTVLATIASRNLWIQGFADQSLDIIRDCIEHATAIEHSISIGMAFSTACIPLSIMMGELDLAGQATKILLDHSKRNSLLLWQPAANIYAAAISVRLGIRNFGYEDYVNRQGETLAGPLLEVVTLLGDDLVPSELLSRVNVEAARWCRPEIIRARGSRLAKAGDLDGAHREFSLAILEAEALQAPAFALRAATSLAILSKNSEREAEGARRLEAVLGKFTEGFETRDVRMAIEWLRARP